MDANSYLKSVLRRVRVDTGPFSPVRNVIGALRPHIERWGGSLVVSIEPSGSFAKGTAITIGTDIDVFVSLSSTTSETLQEIHRSLANRLLGAGFAPKPQNVSIGASILGYKVDVVPAKRHDQFSDDHSLFRSKAATWTKTNVTRHISTVRSSGRIEEIMILKAWRGQRGLEFPSFYLELATIRACSGRAIGDLANNVSATFAYIRDRLETETFTDPSNTNNRISDDLSASEKRILARAAAQAISAPYWSQVVQ